MVFCFCVNSFEDILKLYFKFRIIFSSKFRETQFCNTSLNWSSILIGKSGLFSSFYITSCECYFQYHVSLLLLSGKWQPIFEIWQRQYRMKLLSSMKTIPEEDQERKSMKKPPWCHNLLNSPPPFNLISKSNNRSIFGVGTCSRESLGFYYRE